jgi:type II secretory pathway component PulJ
MTAILALLGPKLLTIGGIALAALLALVGIRWQAKSQGRAEARQEQEKANAEAMVRGAEVQRDVRAAGPAAAREHLRDHYRPRG